MAVSFAEALQSGAAVEAVEVPFVRYRFVFEVTAPILLPPYSGSTIRGAFGRALRRTSCMTHQSDCKTCPLYRTCPYTQVFETPPPPEHPLQKFSQIPNAYVIEPPKWGRHVYEVGENLEFQMVLFGRVRQFLPLVIYALQRAFAYDVGHGKAELIGVFSVNSNGERRVYAPDMSEVLPHSQSTVLSVPSSEAVALRIETPMRLQNNGVPLGPEIVTSRNFLSALLRRMALISEFQCNMPLSLNFSALTQSMESVSMKKDLGWKDWQRYSSRQDRKMNLGGVVGSTELEGLTAFHRTLLAVGQMIHAGKNATFGLGKYRLLTTGKV